MRYLKAEPKLNIRNVAMSICLVAIVLLTISCSDSNSSSSFDSNTSASSAPNATDQNSSVSEPAEFNAEFYETPDDLQDRNVGSVIRSEELKAEGGQAWRFLYVSTDRLDTKTAVSSLLYIPEGITESGALVSWAHPTVGVADKCAPSRTPALSLRIASAALAGVDAAFVASDYQGLGTDGLHPYLDPLIAANNLVDAVTAAKQIRPFGDDVLVWGYSQGAHAALDVARSTRTLPSNFALKGVVAQAPPTNLAELFAQSSVSNSNLNYVASAVHGAPASGIEIDPDRLLTPLGKEAVSYLESECSGEISDRFNKSFVDYFTAEFSESQVIQTLISSNSIKATDLSRNFPIFIAQGALDKLVPSDTTAEYVKSACEVGADVSYLAIPFADHSTVAFLSADRARRWASDRLVGLENHSDC